MSKRDADIRISSIARRIVADTENEPRNVSSDLEGMLQRVQSDAISLSASISELISLIKRQDPEYAAAVDAMENPQPNEEPDESDGSAELDESVGASDDDIAEADGAESKDEKE